MTNKECARKYIVSAELYFKQTSRDITYLTSEYRVFFPFISEYELTAAPESSLIRRNSDRQQKQTDQKT